MYLDLSKLTPRQLQRLEKDIALFKLGQKTGDSDVNPRTPIAMNACVVLQRKNHGTVYGRKPK